MANLFFPVFTQRDCKRKEKEDMTIFYCNPKLTIQYCTWWHIYSRSGLNTPTLNDVTIKSASFQEMVTCWWLRGVLVIFQCISIQPPKTLLDKQSQFQNNITLSLFPWDFDIGDCQTQKCKIVKTKILPPKKLFGPLMLKFAWLSQKCEIKRATGGEGRN